MNPLISIVTGTYNRLALLQRLVASVRADIPVGIPYEIILCDGGSTDGTLEWIAEQADCILLAHGELRGAIAAFTDAANMARGKYTVLLNDDVEVLPGTLVNALVHLEENPDCGQVAFYDDRAVPGYWQQGQFHVLHMAANRNGGDTYVVYGQCSMVRTWLGKQVNWWRGHDERFASARTYAGDNLLSASIWQLGFTVDPVKACQVRDYVHQDGMRAINVAAGEEDARAYYSIYPQGVPLADKPQIPQQDKRQLRILYLPIYEPGWQVQKEQKRGLRDALARRYIVYEFDYVAMRDNRPALQAELMRILETFQPDLLLTQLHGDDIITPDMLQGLRQQLPRLVVINWNGDYWPHGLTSQGMLKLLAHVDLQLTVNASVLDTYKAHGIPAAYWQIGYEEAPEPLPDMPAHDVVFLGNAYSDQRKELGRLIMSFADHDCYIGLYGSGWTLEDGRPVSDGNTTYDFAKGAAIYRNAKIAIGDSQFPDAYGFVSNRIFQALAAGGALLLHQTVPGLKELTGLEADQHYIEWSDFDDLRAKIEYWLNPANEDKRREIAERGTRFVRHFHSFDMRVQELFGQGGLITQARRQPAKLVSLVFTGPAEAGGVMGQQTRKHYTFVKGVPLQVDALDAPAMVATGQWRPYV